MTALTHRPNRDGSLILGGGLMVVGLVALAMTLGGLDPSRWLGGSGWTLFVIVPGVLLLSAGLLTERPAAEGLTIAGSIVTTIGVLLLAMDQSGRYDAWAYAWALIPMAAGAGVVLHGLRAGDRSSVAAGLRLGGIAAGPARRRRVVLRDPVPDGRAAVRPRRGMADPAGRHRRDRRPARPVRRSQRGRGHGRIVMTALDGRPASRRR